MQRTRLNFALAGLVAVLGIIVVLSQKKPAPKGAPLTALQADAITHIALSHPDKPDIVLDKHGEHWQLSAPVQAAADALEVNSLLSIASSEVKTTLTTSEVDKTALGLDKPATTVKFNATEVHFGGTDPIQYQRYAETGGHIVLIGDPPASALDADYSELVAKNLLPEGAEVLSIEVPRLRVQRTSDGKNWQAEPASDAATPAALQGFVDHWRNARSLWNQLDSSADSGKTENTGGEPVRIVVKTGEQTQTLDLHIISRAPQFVIADPALHLRYTLSKADADTLLRLPEPAAKPVPAAGAVATPHSLAAGGAQAAAPPAASPTASPATPAHP